MNIRLRFAPSPTGFLHIGGARTALFNWLYARHTGGKFILRIEDTDTARNTTEAVSALLDGLRWLGLDWDEGPVTAAPSHPGVGNFGPYFQSQRREIYHRRVHELLDRNLAYRADGAVKFRLQTETTTIQDMVVGEVTRQLTDRERENPDFVIVRSDGHPVFHLVNVVDDMEMGITHVIRGEDHLSNTARHIALFRAFEVDPPQYAHIPLILNANGSKMSKRDEGASLHTYMESGYAPEAVINYLSLLGWSPKDDREVLSREELITRFDIPQILRSNSRFDAAKMKWMNVEHIKRMDVGRFRELGIDALHRTGIDTSGFDSAYLDAALATCREKIKQFTDLPAFAAFYFQTPESYDPEAARKHFVPENRRCWERLLQLLRDLEPFDAPTIEAGMKELAGELGVKVGQLIHPTRLACTGARIGPSLYHLMEVLGKSRVIERMEKVKPRMQTA